MSTLISNGEKATQCQREKRTSPGRENLRGKLFKGAGNLIKDAENYGDARN
jgi:hypothetical protein